MCKERQFTLQKNKDGKPKKNAVCGALRVEKRKPAGVN
jgi:hypothetical protein